MKRQNKHSWPESTLVSESLPAALTAFVVSSLVETSIWFECAPAPNCVILHGQRYAILRVIARNKPVAYSDYDIRPTTPLAGLHLRGVVVRRFLISYPVPPTALAHLLPPGAELSLSGGLAWVSACFVNTKQLRPSVVPGPLGLEFNYLVHRTRARLPYPDGVKRESVLVLEANINNRLFAELAARTAGVRFKAQDVTLRESRNGWRVQMRNAGGQLLYRADIAKSSIGATLPQGSRFSDVAAADKFLLNVAYGGQWQRQQHRLHLLAETHDPWHAQAGACKTDCFAFLESIHPAAAQADHVITMTDIPHYFALRGTDTGL